MTQSSNNYKDSAFRKHTSSPSDRLGLLISLKHFTAFGSIWFFCALSAAALADDVPWRQYENGNFVAYSNASESNVAIILESLEEFRSAAFQIPSFVIPAGRPKTLVILPATHDEFLQFAHYETVAGFSTVLAGRPTIVMPASNPNIDIRAVVGHEFAHTLLFNDYFKHPSWYAEGFAEIASSIVVDSDNDSFTIGARDDHRRKASKPAIDWNTLVDSSFDAHAQGSLDRTASAYAQDWLLVHYLTLNKSVDYASELNQYIANLNNGMPSNEAFPNAFGKTAADFWQQDLRVYLEQIENSAFFYDTTMEDLDFIVSNAVNNELQPMLKFLRDFANARHGRNAPDDPTDYLPGRWDWFKLENQCSEPMTIHVRAGTGIMVLESFYSADDSDPVPALFDIEEDDTGALVLINITSLEYPHVTITSDYQALMRSEDVMCFDAQPAARDCLRILHRCE